MLEKNACYDNIFINMEFIPLFFENKYKVDAEKRRSSVPIYLKKNLKRNSKKVSNKKPRIILIEDDPIVCEISKRFLESAGCKVKVAQTGAKAFSLLKLKHDLVLLDIGLPDISGLDILTHLQVQQQQKVAPIVVLTASKELKKECHTLGADDFLVKPLNFNLLHELLHKWIGDNYENI